MLLESLGYKQLLLWHEEVIGSIPIRSTNYLKHLEALLFRDFVASLSQIPKPHQKPALLSLILLVLSSPVRLFGSLLCSHSDNIPVLKRGLPDAAEGSGDTG